MSFLDCHPSAGERMRYTLFFSWSSCLLREMPGICLVWFWWGFCLLIYLFLRQDFVHTRETWNFLCSPVWPWNLSRTPTSASLCHSVQTWANACSRLPVFIFLKKEYLFPCALPAYYVCAPRVCRVQKRVSNLLRLELQMIVSCRVGARNQPCVFWKTSQRSQLLGNLSSSPSPRF